MEAENEPAHNASSSMSHDGETRPLASYRLNFTVYNRETAWVRDDLWSGLIAIVLLWLVATMTLMFGFYGAVNFPLGPNCSRLIQANPLFVQSIKAQEIEKSKHGIMLYGFHETPPLDIEINWSKIHTAVISSNLAKSWEYFLNEGASVNISYGVKSPSSVPLSLIIAQGKESFLEWVYDPSYSDTTLSWNIIQGNGIIHQKITTSNMYYIAVGNFNTEVVEVQLNFTVRDFHYDTSNAYYKCSPSNRSCRLNLFFQRPNAAVLASPIISQGAPYDDWHVKLSYGPRWITYIAGFGAMTAVVLLAFKLFNKLPTTSTHQTNEIDSERSPLLSHKEDDLSSLGSSYDSLSQEDEELDEKPPIEGENDQNLRLFCAICFDAPRDSFFLPCGHSAVCFTCGTRTIEEAGTCPICRRATKKVRKIFAV